MNDPSAPSRSDALTAAAQECAVAKRALDAADVKATSLRRMLEDARAELDRLHAIHFEARRKLFDAVEGPES